MIEFNESFVIAICFVVFLYIAYRPIRKAIVSSLDARINDIKKKLSEVEKLKNDAKQLLDKAQEEVESFEKRKQEVLDSAKVSTEKMVEMKTKEMDMVISRQKDAAVKSIKNEKVKAGKLMKKEFTESVLKLANLYLKETDNNSASDKDIFDHLLKDK